MHLLNNNIIKNRVLLQRKITTGAENIKVTWKIVITKMLSILKVEACQMILGQVLVRVYHWYRLVGNLSRKLRRRWGLHRFRKKKKKIERDQIVLVVGCNDALICIFAHFLGRNIKKIFFKLIICQNKIKK